MSTKDLSYHDAARILGGTDNAAIAALDKIMGGLLLAGTITGHPLAISLFEAKDEFVKLSEAAWKAVADRAIGLTQYQRTQRIVAANAVIVVASFFDTLRYLDNRQLLLKIRLPSKDPSIRVEPVLPGEVWPHVDEEVTIQLMRAYRREINEAREERKGARPRREAERNFDKLTQVSVSTRGEITSGKLISIVDALIKSPIPIPAPQTPYEETLEELCQFYGSMSDSVSGIVYGKLWEYADEGERRTFSQSLNKWASGQAILRYEDQFRRLAVEFPEIAFWANSIFFQAIQNEIAEVRKELRGLGQVPVSLQGLENAFVGQLGADSADSRRTELANYYRAALDRPIVESGEVSASGMTIPPLKAAYINPSFKTCDVQPGDPFYRESWWEDPSRMLRADLQKFLYGYLKSPGAVNIPLMVLGQPGSGKSVLTKTIAARLPPSEFFVVRVSLRDVAAESDIQIQLEQSLYAATGHHTSWPDIASRTLDATRIIILDGFDELLQATGVSQSDYLEKVALFQDRELRNGRPSVVIVTSRTAVADRARVPDCGMTVVRLEPFDESQIEYWLGVWNNSNSDYFGAHDLEPLRLSAVMAQRQLASQPLLLLMLALYDADDNALEHDSAGLRRAQLYERLLTRFAERDVRKIHAELPEELMSRQIEHDLMRLAIAAIGMYNRGRQWITIDELNNDFGVLVEPGSHRQFATTSESFSAPLTAADTVLGRFFFIHEARVFVGGVRRGTFEFLHATFGEFLVARIIVHELTELVRSEQFAYESPRHLAQISDSFLYSLLSFAVLPSRVTIIDYLGDLIWAMSEDQQDVLRDLLTRLFKSALDVRKSLEYERYQPSIMRAPTRSANYSANLLILILIIVRGVYISDLFADGWTGATGSEDVVDQWSRLAMLWRSQLSQEGWEWLTSNVSVMRAGSASNRDVWLVGLSGTGDAGVLDELLWQDRFYGSEVERNDDPYISFSWQAHFSAEDLIRRYRFTADLEDFLLVHTVAPLLSSLGFSFTTFEKRPGSAAASCANALLNLWVASGTNASSDALAQAYERCIWFGLNSADWLGVEVLATLRYIIIRQLRLDLKRLPGAWRSDMRILLNKSASMLDGGAQSWSAALIESLGLR